MTDYGRELAAAHRRRELLAEAQRNGFPHGAVWVDFLMLAWRWLV